MSTNAGSIVSPSASFQRALEKFTKSLSSKQREEFQACTLEDVIKEIRAIQERRGNQRALWGMARLQKFIEAMKQYGELVNVFLNSTPFLGFIWGPMKFVLLMADTWVESLDTILNAYQDIGERLPSFMQYQTLFESNTEMRDALDLYFCDVLEFHYNALHLLNRPGWKRLFKSSWKTFDTQFQRILESLRRHKELIESGKSTVSILQLQLMREKLDTHYKEIAASENKRCVAAVLEKLDAPDYQRDQDAASEQRRDSSSGNWLFSSRQYKEWSDESCKKNPILYMHGVPGAGKTILASLIIEDLQLNANISTLFFYCKHNHPRKRRFIDILRAFVAQLCLLDIALASCMYDMCASSDQTGVTQMIEKLATISFESRTSTFVILDGLDECEAGEAEKTMSWLRTYLDASKKPNSSQIRLLCVGQRTAVLQRELLSAVNLPLEDTEHEEDIHFYIRHKARTIREQFELDPQTELDLVTRVIQTAKSMFLFAKLVLENLASQVTRDGVITELAPEVFPVDLKDAYGRLVAGVKSSPQHSRAAAIHIIQWVACAKRPMKWREMQATFFVDPKARTCNYLGRKVRKSCKELCSSLVDIQVGFDQPINEATLHLVHATACQYLHDEGLLNVPRQDIEISLFCMKYLLLPPFQMCQQPDKTTTAIKDGFFALQDYAVFHIHAVLPALVGNSDRGAYSRDQELVLLSDCFIHQYQILENWSRANERLLASQADQNLEPHDHVLQLAHTQYVWKHLEVETSAIRDAIEGYLAVDCANAQDKQVMEEIYGKLCFKCPRIGCDCFQTGFKSKSLREEHLHRHDRPFLCIEKGCLFETLGFETNDKLEKHLAHTHAKDSGKVFKFPQTSSRKNHNFLKACNRGDLSTVQQCLREGVDVNLRGLPLVYAVANSHFIVCKLLLENGAEITYPQWEGQTILHVAASKNDIELVDYLIKSKPYHLDIYQRDRDGNTALDCAISAKATLAIDLIVQDYDTEHALEMLREAASKGDIAKVKQLLTIEKAIPEVRKHQQTALHVAASAAVADLLLESGKFEIDLRDEHSRSPLTYAAIGGKTEVIASLLRHKAFVDLADIHGQTPLIHAVKGSWVEAAEMLLQHNARVNSLDADRCSSLMYAILEDKTALIELLLKFGANTDLPGFNGIAMSFASTRGKWSSVNVLFNYGASMDSLTCQSYPLQLAVQDGNYKLVEFVLQKQHGVLRKVYPDIPDSNGRTPLSYAVVAENIDIFNLLLDTGEVDIHREDKWGYTPLSRAVQQGTPAVIESLLRTGKAHTRHKDSLLKLARMASPEVTAIITDLLHKYLKPS